MLPACARNVYVRLPKNCTEAPAQSAGNRAAIGAMPSKRMHAENKEKSTSVAPLPTTNARMNRSARSVQRSASLTSREQTTPWRGSKRRALLARESLPDCHALGTNEHSLTVPFKVSPPIVTYSWPSVRTTSNLLFLSSLRSSVSKNSTSKRWTAMRSSW